MLLICFQAFTYTNKQGIYTTKYELDNMPLSMACKKFILLSMITLLRYQ